MSQTDNNENPISGLVKMAGGLGEALGGFEKIFNQAYANLTPDQRAEADKQIGVEKLKLDLNKGYSDLSKLSEQLADLSKKL